jgi:OmpA-OmpF porin, OOP family
MLQILLALVLLAIGLPTSAREPLTDHALVKPYEGSVLRRKDVKAFDSYQLITGSDRQAFSGLALEGKVTRLFYDNPKARSQLEMWRNGRDALDRAGVKILFECDQKDHGCVKSYAGPAFQKYSGIHGMGNADGRFVSAKVVSGDATAYLAIAVGRSFTDVHVIEVKPMESGKAGIDAAALGNGLNAEGFVVVEGIFFDTDKTTIKPASKPALEQVAKLLAARPALKLLVVGHTDMQGLLEHNMALSRGRAQAVVDALVADHQVAPGRMEGLGVGLRAPQATNASEQGRGLNRRVVLVAR